MLYSPILSFLRIFPLIFWVIACLTIHFINFFYIKKRFFYFLIFFLKAYFTFFGIKVKFSGKIQEKNVLFISNHVSYLDIFILGSITKGLFVAKSEIKSWPLINKIAALGRTIFIDRSKSFSIKNQINVLSDFFEKSQNIILFLRRGLLAMVLRFFHLKVRYLV